MKRIQLIIISIFSLLVILFLILGIKGQIGNPIYYQTQFDTRVGSPFESSNSTARYALVYSIVKNHSLTLSKPLANFSSPDVVTYKGKYLSIFTPGVSLIGVPFFILGEIFAMPQLVTYLSILLFSFVNVLLVAYLSIKLGARLYTGLLSGFIYLFATDAFAYALSFTQHQESVTVVLLALINSLQPRTLVNNLIFGLLMGIGLLLDVPVIVILFPMLVYIIYKHFHIVNDSKKIKLSLKLSILGLVIGILPMLGVFAWYNYETAGSVTKIAQFIGRSSSFSTTQAVPSLPTSQTVVKKGISLPFKTRIQVDGLYTLLISNERSWIYYSPVVFVGLIGLYLAYKKAEKRAFVTLILASVLVNIILYSMFGDPWGGWSFGPRYLIPAAGLLCIGIGVVVEKWKRDAKFIIVFLIILFYSLTISALGAFTTSAIPPKAEAIHLLNPIPYTYAYNFNFIEKNQSSSLLYNLFFIHYIQLQHYLAYFVELTAVVCILLYGCALYQDKLEKE